MKTFACICLVTLSILSSRGADFDLGSHGTLSIAVPDDWRVNGQEVLGFNGKVMEVTGYALAIKPRNCANAKCLLTFLYGTNGAPNLETIREGALAISEEFVEGSVEKKQTLHAFTLEKGCGAYCCFSDASLVGKAVEPGDFRVMAIGEVQPGDNLPATVSLFANDLEGADFKAMVKMVNSLTLKPKSLAFIPEAGRLAQGTAPSTAAATIGPWRDASPSR